MHRAKARIEIAPASIAIERHGESAIGTLDANDAGIARSWCFDRIRLHHVVILLPHPAFRADVWARQQTLELDREISSFGEADVFRHFTIDRRLPASQRTFVHRCVIGKRGVGNFGNNFAVCEHTHLRIVCNAANFHRIQSPLLEDAKNFLFAAFLCDQQHALL